MVLTGLDCLVARNFDRLRGRRVGFVCNQATITKDGQHLLEHLKFANLTLCAIFGPQHGLFGHTQDNMIEWEGAVDPRIGVPIYSLYGEHRKPTPQMLKGVDVLVIDLPDIGSRYYTFAWTMAYCLEACAELGIQVLVLDRPNPLGGVIQEGPVVEPGFESFVGLYPIPIRHGMTLGELALWIRTHQALDVDLQIEACTGWDRNSLAHESGLPWGLPSPNMPSPTTALLYPGGCLLEGTTISEGRGTTRPFEIVGAPHLDAFKLCEAMNAYELQGLHFRPTQFQPTFNKFAGQVCEGCFVHVRDPHIVRSVKTYVLLIRELWRMNGDSPFWKTPPYEYEFVKMPIDILWGSSKLRESVEADNIARLAWAELP
ncbi:MAG: DUF1343 domain-containing protein [Fimbriimonadaceae bacterium]